MRVFLAPRGICTFLASGSAKIEWTAPSNPNDAPPIWNYVLNYTGSPCALYGGDTIQQAARNSSNGMWLKKDERNCAFYVVVGNNLRNNQRAEFTFYRTSAVTMSAIQMLAIIVISLSLII